MARMILTIVFGLTAFTIGCVSTSDVMEKWVGASRSELIKEWGEPDKVVSDQPNGVILVYVRRDTYSSRGAGDVNLYGSGSRGSDIPGKKSVWERRYLFFVNNDDSVYDWATEKEEVVAPAE